MNDQPATKQDIADAVQRVTQNLADATSSTDRKIADAVQRVTESTKQDLADAVQQVTETLTEAIRDSQTEVLRAFYEWGRPVEVRLRSADDLGRRMGWLEDRVSELERGKLPSTH